MSARLSKPGIAFCLAAALLFGPGPGGLLSPVYALPQAASQTPGQSGSAPEQPTARAQSAAKRWEFQLLSVRRPAPIYDLQFSNGQLLLAEGHGWSRLVRSGLVVQDFQRAPFCQAQRIQIAGGLFLNQPRGCQSSYTLQVRSLAAGRRKYALPLRGDWQALRLQVDGSRLAMARSDGVVRILSLAGRADTQPEQQTSMVPQDSAAVFVAESAAGSEQRLRLTDLQTEGPPILIPEDFSPQLRYLAVRDWRDYYMHIYAMPSGELLHRSEYYIPRARPHLRYFKFSHSGDFYFDGKRLRFSRHGSMLARIPDQPGSVILAADFSPGDTRLAILRQNLVAHQKPARYIQIFKIPLQQSGAETQLVLQSEGQKQIPAPGQSTVIRFDPTGKEIWAGSFDGRLARFELPSS